MEKLAEAGPGLWPFRRLDDGQYFLAVKGSGDLAIAAKLRSRFKFHFYSLGSSEKHVLGILTAFYDRENAPIIMRTVCPDPLMSEVVSALSAPNLEVGFFDMHNAELFGGIWKLTPNGEMPSYVGLPVNLEPHEDSLLDYYIEVYRRFSELMDDGFIIDAELLRTEDREGFTIVQVTKEEVLSRKREGQGIYVSQLDITKDPGDYHEAEIARALARVYSPSNVFVGTSTDKSLEFCDVLALGSIEAVCVQAKSTLRDPARALEGNARRISRATKHFKKAAKQVRGADRAFYRLGEIVLFNSKPLGIQPHSTLLLHIIVIFEKMPSALAEWSPIISELRQSGVSVVVLDTAEFHNLVTTYPTRDNFCRALFAIEESFDEHGGIGEYVFHRNRIATYIHRQ